jgi:hypothetical protein
VSVEELHLILKLSLLEFIGDFKLTNTVDAPLLSAKEFISDF